MSTIRINHFNFVTDEFLQMKELHNVTFRRFQLTLENTYLLTVSDFPDHSHELKRMYDQFQSRLTTLHSDHAIYMNRITLEDVDEMKQSTDTLSSALFAISRYTNIFNQYNGSYARVQYDFIDAINRFKNFNT
jgi:hypothetical protein